MIDWSLIIYLSAVYITVLSANNFVLMLMFFGRSLTYKKNCKGSNTDPWGTPQVTVNSSDCESPIFTYCSLSAEYKLGSCNACPLNERTIYFVLLLTSKINKTHHVKYSKRQQGCCEGTGLESSSQAVTLKAKASTI